MQKQIINNSDLFQSITSQVNILAAAERVLKGKRTRKRYAEYGSHLIEHVLQIHEELSNGTYKARPTKEFDLWCISGQKMRHITVPHLDDCVVQHAIYQKIFPIINPRLIYDNYGCRKGKGTHKASDRCQQFIRESPPDSWFLQIDFKKYYYNLDHSKLKEILLYLLKDEQTVELIFTQFPRDTRIGMNVGAMLSQLMGMIYLNEFDHYIKRVLKVKRYLRYVDDAVLIGLTQQQCRDLKNHLEEYSASKLGLKFSKFKISPLVQGINFVGYRTWRDKRIIRKRSMKRFKLCVKKHKLLSVRASLAHARRTSSYSGMIDYLRNW